MKLTPEQKRGIEERFAVLQAHVGHDADSLANSPVHQRVLWRGQLRRDIEACRDEVLVLVERLECDEAS